mmetsp:Transcript_40183/g.119806  ORF Transcript_40183/g.119806 Transcript_40183/m.119806 type:complete len:242 (+) Transcript_40183:522-1247(+)
MPRCQTPQQQQPSAVSMQPAQRAPPPTPRRHSMPLQPRTRARAASSSARLSHRRRRGGSWSRRRRTMAEARSCGCWRRSAATCSWRLTSAAAWSASWRPPPAQRPPSEGFCCSRGWRTSSAKGRWKSSGAIWRKPHEPRLRPRLRRRQLQGSWRRPAWRSVPTRRRRQGTGRRRKTPRKKPRNTLPRPPRKMHWNGCAPTRTRACASSWPGERRSVAATRRRWWQTPRPWTPRWPASSQKR